MIKTIEKNEAIEAEIKKFFENIENVKSCIDIYSVIVDEKVLN